MLVALLAAIIVHEAGHAAAALAAHRRPRPRLNLRPIPHICIAALPGAELAIALAGPAASLLLAYIGAATGNAWLAIWGLVTAAEVAIPVRAFDGARVLAALKART